MVATAEAPGDIGGRAAGRSPIRDRVLVVNPLMVEPFEPLFGLPESVATSAKLLQLEQVPLDWAVKLNRRWHSVLPELLASNIYPHAFALVFDNGIYAVAIWTRPIAANRMAHPTEHLVELRRYAIPDYAPKFTATRGLGLMARWFRRNTGNCRLLSYQATDVHSGTIYKAANWTAVNTQAEHQTWNNPGAGRSHNPNAQSDAPKVRWELQLRPCLEES